MFTLYSRYKHTEVQCSADRVISLNSRPVLSYQPNIGEIAHVVVAGDTLVSLANQYYSSLPSPNSLWWAIAEFQPDPIIDPTVALTVGDLLLIPPADAVQAWLLADVDDISDMI